MAPPRDELRDDGSPASSGITVPIPLPKRRLLGYTMEFLAPLHIGEPIAQRAEVADIRLEVAPDGPVIHTLLRHTIDNESGPAIIEERAFFYLGENAAAAASATQRPPAEADWERAAHGYDGQGYRLALERMRSSSTGSTTATERDKQEFGGMIRQRNTP